MCAVFLFGFARFVAVHSKNTFFFSPKSYIVHLIFFLLLFIRSQIKWMHSRIELFTYSRLLVICSELNLSRNDKNCANSISKTVLLKYLADLCLLSTFIRQSWIKVKSFFLHSSTFLFTVCVLIKYSHIWLIQNIAKWQLSLCLIVGQNKFLLLFTWLVFDQKRCWLFDFDMINDLQISKFVYLPPSLPSIGQP